MTFAVLTFGCRVNQADSLAIEDALRRRGAVDAAPEAADVVIVNTCSVTAGADQGARQAIRRLARANPRARLVVTGCYATRDRAAVAALPGVAEVVTNERKEQVVEFLASGPRRSNRGPGPEPRIVERGTSDLEPGTLNPKRDLGAGPCGLAIAPGVAGRTVYTLRVQTGCDEACTYCVIPSTRGRSRSVPPPLVTDEVRRAVAAGFKEIVLVGVHLGSYGRDFSPARALVDLLRVLVDEAGRLAGDVRFRLSSLEPMDCSVEIVDLVARAGCFAPHFHLPLQHASDRVLERMRRPYTLAHYRRIVDRIRERIPHAAIGTDVMVGFPGETDEDFAATERYLRTSPLTSLHVFPYSERPGTPASRFAGKVPGFLVRARGERLRQVGAELAGRFRSAQLGTERPALTLEDGTVALTDNYLKVRIPPGLPRNTWVTVQVEQVQPELRGRVVAARAET